MFTACSDLFVVSKPLWPFGLTNFYCNFSSANENQSISLLSRKNVSYLMIDGIIMVQREQRSYEECDLKAS